MIRHCSAVALLACLSVVGCKSMEDRDKEHPDHGAIEELKEKLANLKGIQKDAKKRDKLASTALELKKKGGYLCHFIDLPKDSQDHDLTLVLGEHDVDQCSSEASQRPGNASTSTVERCNEIRYVVAIKTRVLAKPALNDKGFTGGMFEYDALVYDFESGKYKGGAVLKAESSDTVKGKSYDVDVNDKLLTDLLKNACNDVGKAIDSAAKSAAK